MTTEAALPGPAQVDVEGFAVSRADAAAAVEPDQLVVTTRRDEEVG